MSESSPAPVSSHLLSNKVYDVLKSVVTTGLPAVGTFYYALAQIWSWPNAEAVLGSVAAVNTLLGLLLGLSTLSYEKSDAKYDGVLNVGQNEDGVMSITGNVNGEDPSVIANMKSIMFKVNNPNA